MVYFAARGGFLRLWHHTPRVCCSHFTGLQIVFPLIRKTDFYISNLRWPFTWDRLHLHIRVKKMASAELIHICVCTFTVSNMIDCECVSVCTPKHMQTTSISPCTHRLPGRNWSWSPEGTSGRSTCISPNKSQRNVRSSRKNEATAS